MNHKRRITIIFTLVYTIIISAGCAWWMDNKSIHLDLVMICIWAVLILGLCYLALIFVGGMYSKKSVTHNEIKMTPQKLCVNFVIIWILCIVTFLNLYPGTLACDQPTQLTEAVTMSGFENLNPFINTVFLTVFVQIGMRISSISCGVALYSFVQLTFYSVVMTFMLYVVSKSGINKYQYVICLILAIWPVNLMYAVGMWKDTFFALTFIMTMSYMMFLFGGNCKKYVTLKQGIVLSVMTIICSLARNSGWSALVVMDIMLILYGFNGYRNNIKFRKGILKIAIAQTIGILISLLIIGFIYPALGIKSYVSSTGISVPMQQVARVSNEGNYSPAEKEAIELLLAEGKTIDDLANSYTPNIVDPVRNIYNSRTFEDGSFYEVWKRLWKNHKSSYVMAVINHTVRLWWPFEDGWVVDNRIMENTFGVGRDSKVFKYRDITFEIYEMLSRVRLFGIFSNSGFTFCVLILSLYLCLISDNVIGAIMHVPMLLIYIGLILFCYGSLFRYTYAAVLGMPLLFAFNNYNVNTREYK